MKLIELLMRVPPNQQGEIIGVPDEVADAMVERMSAKYYIPPEKRTSRVRLEEVDHKVEPKKPEKVEAAPEVEPEAELPVEEEVKEVDPEEEKQAKPGRKKSKYVTKG
jgi:hypothetical protein